MASRETVERVIQVLVENSHPKQVVLFGSHASGRETSQSDIDLLVVKDLPSDTARRTLGVRRHMRGMNVAVDILVYTPKEVDYWKGVSGSLVSEAYRTGRVVYG